LLVFPNIFRTESYLATTFQAILNLSFDNIEIPTLQTVRSKIGMSKLRVR